MQLASDVQIPDGLLAEMALLREKPRLGFRAGKCTAHQGLEAAKSLNRIGDTTTVVRYSWQMSLKAQQTTDNSSSSSSTSGQDQTHYASVSYWPKGAGGFGHIGIGVDTDDTQGYSTADPHVPWYKRIFGAPAGGTEDDIQAHTKNGEVAPHGYLHIAITADQAAAMKGAMADRAANGGHYNLIFNNCAQFVESVLHAGGVSGVPHAEVFGPAVLGGILWAEH